MRRKATPTRPTRTTSQPTRHASTTPQRLKGDYRLTPTLVGIAIVVATLMAYGNLYGKGVEWFRLDDGDYIVRNPFVAGDKDQHIPGGLTAENMAWAFTAFYAANWHPLTWLSLQLDYDIYGLDPGGFHLTNVILHAAAAVLLLVVLERMTRAFWPSAFVAALFALHPLRVESVAWIAERKDVLGAFFWILTMGVYAWYAHKPSLGRYLVVVASFVVGLLAKPMLVTLPCALFLLDYWPLRRFGSPESSEDPRYPRASMKQLLLEKLPLLALSAAASLITVLAQKVKDEPLFENLSLPFRVLNAALAYVGYLVQTFWPSGLAPLYTRPLGQFPVTEGLIALAILVVITLAVLVVARRMPYLPVGWLWFLGTLVPVIGLVQVGIQTMADRYTYIPHIGLFIAITWLLHELLGNRVPRAVMAAGAAAILAGCFLLTYRLAFLWRDNIALWEHTTRVTGKNFGAEDNLGVAFMGKAKDLLELLTKNPALTAESRAQIVEEVKKLREDAVPHFRTAVEIEPRYAVAHMHLGLALAGQEKWTEAIEPLSHALRLSPDLTDARQALSNAYMRLGRMEEALEPLQTLVRSHPTSPEARFNLARAFLYAGRTGDAEREAIEAIRLNPRLAQPQSLLGTALALRGKPAEAEARFRTAGGAQRTEPSAAYHLAWALQAQGKSDAAREQYRLARERFPSWPRTVREEAWKLATDPDPRRRNGPLALLKAQTVSQALDGDAQALDTLAAALAECGRYPEAVAAVRQALNDLGTQRDLESPLRSRLALYEQGKPYRESK